MSFSAEERQARSERAKAMVASGKIGGPRPGSGRPRKKRASELVAEQAEKHAGKIVEAFVDALQPGKPDNVRLNAARTWLEIENKEAQLQLEEERELEKLPRAELLEELVASFAEFHAAGILPETVDSEAEVIE